MRGSFGAKEARGLALLTLASSLNGCGSDPASESSAASTGAVSGSGGASSSGSGSGAAAAATTTGSGAGAGAGGEGNVGGTPEVECEPTGTMPQLLAEVSHPGGGVALTPTHLYWLEPKMNATLDPLGEVRRIERCGGGSDVLTLEQPAPFDAVAVGTTVYWTNLGTEQAGDIVDGSVRSVNIAGGIDVLVTDDPVPGHIAADAEFVYWTGWWGVRGKSLKGGVPFTISSFDAEGIAVDEEAIYWATESGSLVRAVKEQDGQQTELAAGECLDGSSYPSSGCVALDETHAYWLDPCGSIRAVPKSGGTIALLAEAEGQGAYAPFGGHRLAVDDQHVYWVNNDSVMRVDKAGAAEPVAIAASGPVGGYVGAIVLGSDDVFWSAKTGLWRLSK